MNSWSARQVLEVVGRVRSVVAVHVPKGNSCLIWRVLVANDLHCSIAPDLFRCLLIWARLARLAAWHFILSSPRLTTTMAHVALLPQEFVGTVSFRASFSKCCFVYNTLNQHFSSAFYSSITVFSIIIMLFNFLRVIHGVLVQPVNTLVFQLGIEKVGLSPRHRRQK